MRIPLLIRFAFVCLVAVLAAAIADPLVEFASNAGWFGAGHFTDGSTLDVLPALSLAGLLGAALFALQLSKLIDGRAAGWLATSESVLRGRSLLVAIPMAFTLQIGVLYTMETVEQTIVRGHALGGTIWLGGPTLMSLFVHAIACMGVAFAVLRLLGTFTRVAKRIIARIFEPISRSLHPIGNRLQRSRDAFGAIQRICALAHLRERAPPLQRT